ncbi:MAG: hypothetical protein ACRD6W_16180 [Nitrososphaerales archaeon]
MPRTSLVGHPRTDHCVDRSRCADALRDNETGEQTPLAADDKT